MGGGALTVVAIVFRCQPDELFLNLVLEYVPETVFNITRHYLKAKQLPPLICVKVGARPTRGSLCLCFDALSLTMRI